MSDAPVSSRREFVKVAETFAQPRKRPIKIADLVKI
jgi:hypothetical protein